jgi:predicted Zn-dependent protease
MRMAVALALLLLAGCEGPRATTVPPTPTGTLYLVPVGEAPPDFLHELIGHFKIKHNLTVETIPPVVVEEVAVDRDHNQVVAEELLVLMERSVAEQARGGSNALVGVTTYDMRIRGVPQWQFAFAHRQGRRAVVSTARMDPVALGEAADAALLRARMRKMVTKQVGLIYFGLAPSSDRRSVLFTPILGVDDLDSIGEDF